ncbi:tetratricopeptide repeat protein [Streptomyces sp. NPDC012888]|uniref:tetratricopeptide repeat protein n=1 Tax=Streptomyces sp. NPDC012888 TaxID=3364855 RepID=UPI0036937CA3
MAKWRWGRRYDPVGRTPAAGTDTTGGASGYAQQVSGTGNATASNGGIAVTGIYNDHSSVVLPPEALRPAAEVRARPGLDNLPYRPRHFVGRAAELDRLDAAMATPSAGVLLQAVHGLGGIGKSALAAHWAATRAPRHGLTPVRWITADSPAGVEQGLAALAMALQPAASRALTVEALAENGMQWLAAHTGWLLVLDNVNDPADIAPLLARAHGGRFLITSRLATVWHDATTTIRLDVLDPAESLHLLTRIADPGGTRDMGGAAELCAELGHLPLAVEAAAAFLAQNPLLTPRTYQDLLRQDPAWMYRQGGAGVTDEERTIACVWRVTLDRVEEVQPLAVDALRALAWYAPDLIPADLLGHMAEPAAAAGAIGVLNAYSMLTVDPGTRSLAMHRLAQSVLRAADPEDRHRTPDLVDAARSRATAALLAAVQPSDWQDPASWPTGRAMLPHMDAVAHHTPPAADTTTTARLLNHAGVFLLSQGAGGRAAAHLRRALDHHERTLGPDHIDTLACRHGLADAFEAAGDLARAVPLYERALADEERVLGPTHPLTLAGRNNLADAYRASGDTDRARALLGRNVAAGLLEGGDRRATLAGANNLARAVQTAGDLDEAIRLFESAYDGCVRDLGADHHLTLVTRHNLTAARAQAGRAGDADRLVALFEQDLDDTERVLGEDHPDTLNVRAALAHAYKQAGDPDRALPLYERTLRDMERVHGEQHNLTRRMRMALALAYHETGDPDRADSLGSPRPHRASSAAPEPGAPQPAAPHGGAVAPTDEQPPDTRDADLGYAFLLADDPERAMAPLRRSLHDVRQDLGEEHRTTLSARHNLAVAHLKADEPASAIPLLRANLNVQQRERGANHASTLTTLRHLADAHRQAGDLEPALRLYGRTFRGLTRTLGAEHPDTLAALNCLAYTHRLAGRPEDAIPLHEEALPAVERELGPSHLDTLAARNSLAASYRDVGDLARSVALYERNLAACARDLGEDHPHTSTARHNLAGAYAAAGDHERALACLEDTLPHQERLLGAEHPDTLTTRMNIAATYRALGRRKEAIRLYRKTLDSCIRALGLTHPVTLTAHAHLVAAKRSRR